MRRSRPHMALLEVSEETARAALHARASVAWFQGPRTGIDADADLDKARSLLGVLAGREAHRVVTDRARSQAATVAAQALHARARGLEDATVGGELRAAAILLQKLELTGEDDDG